MLNMHILEKIDLAHGIVPIDLGSARSSDIISLKNHGRCAIVFYKEAGSASEDPTLTLLQATSVAGSSSKALSCITEIWTKQGTLTSTGTWTKTTQAAANTYVNLTASENEAIWVIDIQADSLDVDNGFDCIQVTIADAGSTNQMGALLFVLHEPRYGMSAGAGLSSLAN